MRSPRQIILLVFLILGWELGWGTLQNRPVQGSADKEGTTLWRGSLVRSPHSFLKALPRHGPPLGCLGTQLFFLGASLLWQLSAPLQLWGSPLGKIWPLCLSILAAAILLLASSGDVEEEEGRGAEKGEDCEQGDAAELKEDPAAAGAEFGAKGLL